MFNKPVICLLSAAFLLVISSAFSQERDTASNTLKYFNKTELGVSFGIGSFPSNVYNGVTYKVKNDEIVATLQTVNGVMYNNRWLLGVSLGVEKWRYGLFWPVYGYLGYNFKQTDNTFFANIYLGYGIGTRYSRGGSENRSYIAEGRGAFALMIGVGYKMKVSNKLKFGYEIFYKYQALNTSYQNWYKADTAKVFPPPGTVYYKLGLSYAGFKIAIFFP
ncbi:MAG: hypothetical protein NTY96_11915 [Bacteroidetes bacterium]|nr:hypothetical protein [Bacteroidota bacterium]